MIRKIQNNSGQTKIQSIVFSALLIMMFTFGLIYYTTIIQNSNNAPEDVKIGNSKVVADTQNSINHSIQTAGVTFQKAKGTFENDTPNILAQVMILTSIVPIVTSIGNVIVQGLTLPLQLIFVAIFGGSTADNPFYFLFVVFMIIMLIAIILLSWRLFRAGE